MSKRSTLVLTVCLMVAASLVEAVPASATPARHAQVGPASATTDAVSLRAGRHHKWKAPRGPFFNDPHRKAGHFRIERRVIDTIKHARRGSTIRIAVYSFDRMPVADALVKAYRRGVKVQMLLNDHQNTRAMKRIRAVIGANRASKSFIYRCKAGCRSTANGYNNLHSKFYSFSRAGRSEDVLAIGSANMMLNAVLHQWNDLYFSSGDHELFRQFINLFDNMKKDFDRRRPPRHFCGTPSAADCDDAVDKHTVWAFPRRSGPTNDLVIDMLDKVQCLTPDGAGGVTRTRLALSMHTMRGRRGDYLARAVREKYAEGCAFRVNYGLIGYHTKKILGAPTVARPDPAALDRAGLQHRGRLRPQPRRRQGPDPQLLQPPEVPRHPGHLRRCPEQPHGAHGLVQLGQPRHRQRRDLAHGPRQAGGEEVHQELRLPVGAQAQLAQRLHHHVRDVPRRPDGAHARRHDGSDVRHGASPCDHGGAGPLPEGSLLGG